MLELSTTAKRFRARHCKYHSIIAAHLHGTENGGIESRICRSLTYDKDEIGLTAVLSVLKRLIRVLRSKLSLPAVAESAMRKLKVI